MQLQLRPTFFSCRECPYSDFLHKISGENPELNNYHGVSTYVYRVSALFFLILQTSSRVDCLNNFFVSLQQASEHVLRLPKAGMFSSDVCGSWKAAKICKKEHDNTT